MSIFDKLKKIEKPFRDTARKLDPVGIGIDDSVRGTLNGPADGPKAKPSATDIINAVVAGRNDERYQQAFMPLELQAIQQAQSPAYAGTVRATLAGKRNADVASAESDAIKAAVMRAASSHTALQSGANVSAFDTANTGTAAGLRAAQSSAGQDAQKFQDAQLMAAANTGRGLARDTAQTAQTLAGIQDNTALSRLRSHTLEQQARNAALGQVSLYGAGAAYGLYNSMTDPRLGPKIGGAGTTQSPLTLGGVPLQASNTINPYERLG